MEDYDGDPLESTEFATLIGIKGTPNFAPRSDDPEVERKLAGLFAESDAVRLLAFDQAHRVLGAAPRVEYGDDLRQRTLAAITLRQGQPAFRKALLRAYERRCAVTGATTERVLEAAHISPYRGEHTNVVVNGLLLRADIHTLFDSELITIVWGDDGEYCVRVAPSITEVTYRELDGQPLAVIPRRVSDRPLAELLAAHNAGCKWLNADARAGLSGRV